ncbi:MAG TPA: CpsB/CapC family capsule biosynthesis tyrosine phosphatase [Bryobacteraceae bacterium]|jgi:protein-tyrosine phosphatase|nr:CpsB/CapC family capsule biosynthesis tyrosine phosphatase [Bryobacteraceae bacterium]
MIDIHTHILPGLDDGARDLEEALDMLRMAAAAGTTDMVASSHANPVFAFDPQVTEERIAELQGAAGDSIRIHYGCELHLTVEGIENALRFPEHYSIGHRGHLLLEFSDFLVPKTSSGILGRMIERGLHPIIAHPERNPILRTRMSELEAWVERGCSLQVTGQSLLGRFGKSAKNASHQLMARGLVHFLASDAHDLEHRPPVLDEVWRYVEETFDPEAADRLLRENPQSVLEGFPVASGPAHVRKRPWYSFR